MIPAADPIAVALRVTDTLDAFSVTSTVAVDLPFACQRSLSVWQRLSLVSTTSAIVISVAIAALLLASIAVIGRFAIEYEGPETPLLVSSRTRRLAPIWMAALFLVVLSGKLQLMHQFPVKAPYWDQWDGEASGVFIPFSECGLSWRAMFNPHNEHRIFFTRLLALDLLLANGQWDPRLEQVVNAAMHATTAVLVATIFWMAGGRRRMALMVFLCAVTFALPFAWENTLSGFQSTFYFLVLFSVLALWLTTRSRALSPAWFIGWACAVSGLFAAASGVLIPVAIVSIVALKVANEPRAWRDSVANVAAAGLVLAAGAAIASPPLAQHESLRAHSITELGIALARALSWPWVDRPELMFVMWLPLGGLMLVLILRRGKTTELERLVVGLGVWVALHAGAVSYGRGAGGATPAPRYMDFLSLGFVANGMALLAVLDWNLAGIAANRVRWVTVVAWLVFAVGGIARLSDRTVVELAPWKQYFASHVANIRGFVIGGDVAGFKSKAPLVELPFYDPKRLAMLLQEPFIQHILPSAVRAPIQIQPRVVAGNAFVPEGFPRPISRETLERSWGSLSPVGNGATGQFESQAITCGPGGLLRFGVAGYVGQSNQRLQLRELPSGRELSVTASRVPKRDWLDAFVSCPHGPFEIVATDEDPATWFAFREPVEIGRGSWMAESLIANSMPLLFGALGLALVAARLSSAAATC